MDEFEDITRLSDQDLIHIAEGRGPQAIEAALGELRSRNHPAVIGIARRIASSADDELLRATAWSLLLGSHDEETWKSAEETIEQESPEVLVAIVEEMATTADDAIFGRTALIRKAGRRLADLPSNASYLADLFRKRFGTADATPR